MILLFAVWLLCGSWLWRRVLQLDAGDGGCSRAYVFVCIGHAMSVLCHIVEHAWAYFPPFVNLTFVWVCVCSWLRFWCGCEWGGFEYGLALRVWRVADCLFMFTACVWRPDVDGNAYLHVSLWKVFRCMGGGIEHFVLKFVFAMWQAGMLGVFELLFCVLEVVQLLHITMLNLIAPSRDDGRDGHDAVDFDCLSCSEGYAPSWFALFACSAWRGAAARWFCCWLFILGWCAGRLNALLCGALHVVSPLLTWFWSAFLWLLCDFYAKYSVSCSLMNDMMSDERLQCQSACACVDMRAWASRFLNGSHSVLRVMYPATAFQAACSCVFRTFGDSFLFVVTMMIMMITTRALLKADVCDRAFAVHPCDLYLRSHLFE